MSAILPPFCRHGAGDWAMRLWIGDEGPVPTGNRFLHVPGPVEGSEFRRPSARSVGAPGRVASRRTGEVSPVDDLPGAALVFGPTPEVELVHLAV